MQQTSARVSTWPERVSRKRHYPALPSPELIRAASYIPSPPPFLSSTTMFRPARIPRLSPALLSRVSRAPQVRGVAGTTPQLPEHALGSLPTSTSPITSKLHFFNSVMSGDKKIPTYRVIDGAGQPIEGAEVPEVRTLFLLRLCIREGVEEFNTAAT